MRRYNKWGGNPDGNPEIKTNCIAEVWSQHLFYQCQKHRGKGPDGLFCGIHAKAIKEGRYVYLLLEDQHYLKT